MSSFARQRYLSEEKSLPALKSISMHKLEYKEELNKILLAVKLEFLKRSYIAYKKIK